MGAYAANRLKAEPPTCLRDAEFRVFSQFGDDGIIQFLIQAIEISDDAFVEIGVQSYEESNTRFLLQNNNWRGLVLDATGDHIAYVRRHLAWRHTVDAIRLFVTQDNIAQTLSERGFLNDIGLLSLDIDGNDYWIWKALRASSPRIVVVEYNSVFGSNLAVSVPYEPNFERKRAHYSLLYFGASLGAMVHLSEQLGYVFVGSNSAGNNAYFVREDVCQKVPRTSLKDGYVASRFRESLDSAGYPTFVSDHTRRLELIAEMPLVNVATGTVGTVRSLLLERA